LLNGEAPTLDFPSHVSKSGFPIPFLLQ
jgi:hypothetical protein